MNDLHEWFQKNDLCPENILYLYRSDRKTVVHRMDGEEAALYAPLHSVLSVLPENLFLNISRLMLMGRGCVSASPISARRRRWSLSPRLRP